MKIVDSAIQQQQHAIEKKAHRETLTLSDSGVKVTRGQVEKLEKQLDLQQQMQQQLSGMLELSEAGMTMAKEHPQDMMLHYSEEDKRKIELLERFLSKLLGKPYKFQFVSRDDEIDKGDRGEMLQTSSSQSQSLALSSVSVGGGVRQGQNALQGLRVVSRSYYEEYERMQFSSEGRVRLDDGSHIEFSLNVTYERRFTSYEERAFEVGRPKDPVVLDLTGEGLDFSDHKLRIDMDFDGTEEVVNAFKSNAGILVHDEDGNGSVSSAKEIVGASKGDGLYSLIAFDEDNNGWLDAGDAILKQLKLWIVDPSGQEKLIGLDEAGVGAIYLGAIESSFTFKQDAESIAKMHQSSIYLKENGKVGAVHAVDYLL